MHVLLPDGSKKELEDGATGADLAAAIGPGLARAALAIKSDGHLRDLARPLAEGEQVEIVTDRSAESLELIRHDTAHVLAAAVLDLYPGTKISIGPPIEDGFYYDFEFPDGVTVSEHDLPALEEKMREHVKADEPFTREDIDVEAAVDRFRAEGQPYKVELIEDLVRDEGVGTVSLYTNGPFTDLCRTPRPPAGSRRSSCCRWPARTGAATRAARCSRGSTAPRSIRPRTSTRTSSGSSRPARATTASSGASWGCSCSPSCRPGCRSGTPTGW
jgi:threonyl-tRNA synthetase